MSLRYSGPATLRCDAGIFTVHATLSTDVSGGVYSWGGILHTVYVAALRAAGQGGRLTFTAPEVAVEVHVVVAELHPGGGVRLRVDGHGRAPYEDDGEITVTPGVDGATVYQVAEETA